MPHPPEADSPVSVDTANPASTFTSTIINFGDLISPPPLFCKVLHKQIIIQIIKQVKNIFSQITFNFQRICIQKHRKIKYKIFFANQTYASISDIYIFFRYRRPICKSNAIRLVHQTIKKTPGQFRRKAKTPAPSCKATKKNESGDRDGENCVRRSFRQ